MVGLVGVVPAVDIGFCVEDVHFLGEECVVTRVMDCGGELPRRSLDRHTTDKGCIFLRVAGTGEESDSRKGGEYECAGFHDFCAKM